MITDPDALPSLSDPCWFWVLGRYPEHPLCPVYLGHPSATQIDTWVETADAEMDTLKDHSFRLEPLSTEDKERIEQFAARWLTDDLEGFDRLLTYERIASVAAALRFNRNQVLNLSEMTQTGSHPPSIPPAWTEGEVKLATGESVQVLTLERPEGGRLLCLTLSPIEGLTPEQQGIGAYSVISCSPEAFRTTG